MDTSNNTGLVENLVYLKGNGLYNFRKSRGRKGNYLYQYLRISPVLEDGRVGQLCHMAPGISVLPSETEQGPLAVKVWSSNH